MIAQISEYIRNIAMFLIFMAFVGIILPDTKYKGYIDVVMGLVLILTVLGPVLPMLGKDPAQFKPFPEESAAAYGGDAEYYDGVRRGLIRESYVMTLRGQIEELIKDTGCTINPLDVDYDEDTGTINDLSINLVTNREDVEIKNLKKRISSFYNLSIDNIHITVQKEKEESYK